MMNEFQSRTFAASRIDKMDYDTIKKDIELIHDIDESKFPSLLEYCKNTIEARSASQANSIIKELMQTENISRHHAHAYVRVVRLFFMIFTRDDTKEDTSDQLANDFNTLELVSETNIPKLKKLIELLKTESLWYDNFIKQSSVESGLFPFLKGIGTTVELRGVFDRELEIGEQASEIADKTHIDKNRPAVAIVSVAITLDSGTPKRFCFQATTDDIQWLIEELKFALHKSEIIKKELM